MGRSNIRITEGQYKKFKEEGRITELPQPKRTVVKKKEEKSEEKKPATSGWRRGTCRLFTLDPNNPVNTAMTTAKDNAIIEWYEGAECVSPRIRFIRWIWEKE